MARVQAATRDLSGAGSAKAKANLSKPIGLTSETSARVKSKVMVFKVGKMVVSTRVHGTAI